MGRLNEAAPNRREQARPGDTWAFTAGDKTLTITRTTREYVHDLCDAYNAARSDDAMARGVEWYVTPAGELRIGSSADASRRITRQIESRLETERARHNRRSLEAARRG